MRKPVRSTTLIQESAYGTKETTKRILGDSFKDDLGYLYNVEMENSYIGKGQISRFQAYLISLFEHQIDEGKEYKECERMSYQFK